MTIVLTEEPMVTLHEYARIPITFTVDRVLDVTTRDDGEGRFALSERRLDVPYEKNYDEIVGEGPLQWARRFDLSNWALFVARIANRTVGGATVALDTPGLTMLEGRRDLALLWDIRVTPDARRHAVGSALFQRVEAWAQLHGCRQLKIETQTTNVRACRFYERQGCRLQQIHRTAYPEFPEEVQLLWYKDLPRLTRPACTSTGCWGPTRAAAWMQNDDCRIVAGPPLRSSIPLVGSWTLVSRVVTRKDGTPRRGSGPAVSERLDCDRTVIDGAQNLEEHRGLRTHIT